MRSTNLLLSMLTDMQRLHSSCTSISKILRYMLACYNYSIDTIIVGERPYPSYMIPHLGSSYSQTYDTQDTPTNRVIATHFRDDTDIVYMMRESWKMLHCGCAFLNAYYTDRSDNPVLMLERLNMTVEFICTLCEFMHDKYHTDSMTIMSIGNNAKYVVSQVSTRLSCMGINTKTMHTIQPAAYQRYLHMTDKLGIHPDYRCFSASGIKLFLSMLQGYRKHSTLSIQDINMSASTGVSQLLSSGVRNLLVDLGRISTDISAIKQIDDLQQKCDRMIAIHERHNTVLTQLCTMLHSNAFITAVVMDNVVPNASLSTAATQSNQPVTTVSTATAAGIMSGTSILGGSNRVDDDIASQVTESVDDLFSPVQSVSTSRSVGRVGTLVESLNITASVETPPATPIRPYPVQSAPPLELYMMES